MKDQVVTFLQRHPGVFVIIAVAALAGASLAVGVGGPGEGASSGGSGDLGISTSTTAADDAGDGEDGEPAATVPGDGSEVLDGTSGSDRGSEGSSAVPDEDAEIPTDVAHSRDPVDLDTEPPEDDATAVGRWWAATYTAHVGAEPGSDLADRLDPHTTDALTAELTAIPPAATYTAPLSIEGVSVGEPMVDEDGERSEGLRMLRVTVETTNALAVYDLTLVDDDGRWLVDEVSEL